MDEYVGWHCVGGSYNVYYGQQYPLFCVLSKGKIKGRRRKRSNYYGPTMHVGKLTHRLLYYQNRVYEFGIKGATAYSFSYWQKYLSSRLCSLEWSRYQTSDVSTKCLDGCVRNYERVFGEYHVFNNNCHHFANILGNVLCTTPKGYCENWCIYNNYGRGY